MSAHESGAASSSHEMQSQQDHLDREAAALAADILPIFTSAAPVESVWSSERIAFTNERRNIVFGQKLFFDELLSFASVDTSLYPPRSSQQLSHLLTAIFAATALDYLKQLSLVYYLLLDLDAYSERASIDEGKPTSRASERFADTYVVLPQFTDALQGYWLLDNDQYQQAIPLLAIADFIPKVIRTLFLPSPSEHRSDVARAKLLLRFLRTSDRDSASAGTSEAKVEELEMEIQALCFVNGPAHALAEIRAIATSDVPFDDEAEHVRVAMRARLIFKVLEHCFAPPRSAAIQNLLGCNLDAEEELTLESFVLSPPAAMTATWSYVAADVLIIRYISQGRYMDAVGLDRRLGPDVSQGHSTVKDAQQRSKMMEQRKRMIAGAREILPEVQKELLRIEESVEISGGAANHETEETAKDSNTNGSNGKVAANGLADRSAMALTPLSASPATRGPKVHTPSTQAAILSAVVRASSSPSAPSTPTKASLLGGAVSATASPNGTPGRFGSTPQNPAAMIGFLAKHTLSGRKATATASESADEVMEESKDEMDGSGVLVSKPIDSVKNASDATASPSQPVPAPSPWRNQPSFTSSSPFSGLPKLTRPAFAGDAGSVASGSHSRFQSSPRAFQPANTSPFAASSSSMRSSPSLSSTTGRTKLPGALGLVSQHGKKSRLAREEARPEMEDSSDVDDAERQTEDGGDDTFVQTTRAKSAKGSGGDTSIGRLVPGRRGWSQAHAEENADDGDMQELLASPEPPTKRRARKTTTATPKSKMTRSRTGVNLSNSDDAPKMTKSRSEVSLVEGGKRMTRSTSSVNRKPLTLSNLEQHSRSDAPTAPIARRTRAATAELESVNGGEQQAASTIYTISEVGDDDGGRTPAKRGRRAAAPPSASKSAVRRSTRLSSVEPEESSPAKRRGGNTRKKNKMPGSLD
ncbi:ELYS-like domain protein [Kalmanozyma brasiliensis GHG001]|uniref:ELYS-like domain-containing protein n=1 Tax=Kalmanozyma brasiliensis (strain GHG001) TaxID=1365824 RepID=V5ESX1_KALBG|nr:ELYS-like domain protein [Kalmanozyma brasiliensis GHG001]EST06073.1 ELYS-like domain protein [Kalmanozyma brasiliensis GHG001]